LQKLEQTSNNHHTPKRKTIEKNKANQQHRKPQRIT
jgi:hypothetical protein